jgi:uncharacterized protein YggE
MSEQPVISVRGESVLEVEAEIAVIEVTIQARDRDRRTVLSRLASRNQHITDLIKSHGEAVEKLESGQVIVRPDIRERKASERVAGYLGWASVRVTVRDFTILGELVGSLSEEDLVTVAGPWWQLRQDSPVYRDARLAAARNATVRAREYAEAFGYAIGGLIEAADVGLLTMPGERGPRYEAAMAYGGRNAALVSRAASEAGLEFEPARQTVTAQVEARFATTGLVS